MNFCILLSIIFSVLHFSDAYDSIDPKGEIAIKWDFNELRYDGYTVTVSIYNNQLYRHIELPGWKYGWTWGGEEVILHMTGAEATEQGNCTRFKGADIPHSCERSPVIVDLLPGVTYNKQIQNCCRGGVLSSKTQDSSKGTSSFQMRVGSNLDVNDSSTPKPYNFSLGVPGYTCSNVSVVPPTRFLGSNTRHWTQAMLSWRVTCSFSQFRASLMPTCCVSLSTFYNDTIVSCPACSCACQKTSQCPREGQVYNTSQTFDDEYDRQNQYITCTEHMCPIRVHWHLKASYKQHWRVKVTISNFNMVKNYTEWNLVIQHPNLRSLTQVYSFNYKPIIQYGNINDTAMFWGLKYYNDMLLQAGNLGNVQSELLLKKDPGIFTFQGGWAFPRSVLFNGHECVMPSPDEYPSLPRAKSSSPTLKQQPLMMFGLFALTLVLKFL